jgi:invasion protein IalB
MSRVSQTGVFARSTRLLLAAGAVFVLAFGTLPPVTGNAQSVDGTYRTQSVWVKLCFDAPYARSNAESGSSKSPAQSETAKACFTYMEERDEPTGMVADVIGVLNAEALHRTILVAFLRGDVALSPERYLAFPGTHIKLSYLHYPETCDASGCYARAELSQTQLEQMKTAKAMTMSFGNGLHGGRSSRRGPAAVSPRHSLANRFLTAHMITHSARSWRSWCESFTISFNRSRAVAQC